MKALPPDLDNLFSTKENKPRSITENTCLFKYAERDERKSNDLQREMLHLNQRKGGKKERKILRI